MAGGHPIDTRVADQAAAWLTLLMSGEARHEDSRRWEAWRAAHPDHERAWQHIEAVTQHLKTLEPGVARQVLWVPPRKSRRRRTALGLLLGGTGIGAAAWATIGPEIWSRQLADQRTGTGEQRALKLADGSQITLNTASALSVRFDADHRLLRLVAGEIFVATAATVGRPDPRPFIVETAQGSIRALGTRFSVRLEEDRTRVAVQESAVLVTPSAGAAPRIVQAGEAALFSRTVVVASSGPVDFAWVRGQIVAEDRTLGDFLAELGRYRAGVLRWDESVASLRLSGVFPLQDTDRILITLPTVLPIRVIRRTRYWVSITAA